jgi:hypothetical protein
MNPRRRTALVALVAVLGIVLAAAITYGTSQLVRQHIGLASEPITAGRTLLAPVTTVHVHTSAPATAPRSARSQTTPPAITVPREPAPAPAPAPGKGSEASPPATSTSSGEVTRSTSSTPATTESPQPGSGAGGSGPTRTDRGGGTPEGSSESADKQRHADD